MLRRLTKAYCHDISSAAIAEGQVSGLVRSESGRELAGITVTLQGSDERSFIQLTDAFGRYRFDSIESGTYQISYEDRNFINFTDDDPFPDEGSVYISFLLPNLVTLLRTGKCTRDYNRVHR